MENTNTNNTHGGTVNINSMWTVVLRAAAAGETIGKMLLNKLECRPKVSRVDMAGCPV